MEYPLFENLIANIRIHSSLHIVKNQILEKKLEADKVVVQRQIIFLSVRIYEVKK